MRVISSSSGTVLKGAVGERPSLRKPGSHGSVPPPRSRHRLAGQGTGTRERSLPDRDEGGIAKVFIEVQSNPNMGKDNMIRYGRYEDQYLRA